MLRPKTCTSRAEGFGFFEGGSEPGRESGVFFEGMDESVTFGGCWFKVGPFEEEFCFVRIGGWFSAFLSAGGGGDGGEDIGSGGSGNGDRGSGGSVDSSSSRGGGNGDLLGDDSLSWRR